MSQIEQAQVFGVVMGGLVALIVLGLIGMAAFRIARRLARIKTMWNGENSPLPYLAFPVVLGAIYLGCQCIDLATHWHHTVGGICLFVFGAGFVPLAIACFLPTESDDSK